jgi:hypothetical protein
MTTHHKKKQLKEDLNDLPFEQTDTPEGLHTFVKACMKKLADGKIVQWRYNGLLYGVNTMIRINGAAPQTVKEFEERISSMEQEAKQLGKIK